MKKFSMLCFYSAFALTGALNAAHAQARPIPRPALERTATCAPTGEEWMKGAFDYLNTKLPNGKRPAVFATVSLVSLEPGVALGKAPDRTGSWYAHGEVTRYNFPNTWVFEGKCPLWVNNGTDKAPFNGNTSTLGITIRGNGQAAFHYQVDGRNRMGKGPQSITLGAVPSGSSDNSLMFSVATEFFGKKLIVLSLTKGEADMPVVAPKPIGTRYKISPSLFVTNSDDGPGDSTLELRSDIQFIHKGKPVGYLTGGQDMKKGQRIEGRSFEVVVLDADIKTHNLRVKGNAYDYDAATKNDPLWRQDMGFSIAAVANKTKNKGLISITPNFVPDDASANLDILVQKVADVY